MRKPVEVDLGKTQTHIRTYKKNYVSVDRGPDTKLGPDLSGKNV
jgi:hypothetical protein